MPNPIVSNLGASVDLTIAQSTDFGPVRLAFTNPDGTPVDLTGCALAADLRKSPQSAVIATFTVAVQSPATGGVALLSLPYSVTSTLQAANVPCDPAGAYVWDLKFTDAAGNVSRPLFGNVSVWRDVTP